MASGSPAVPSSGSAPTIAFEQPANTTVAPSTATNSTITTTIFVVSDTHGESFTAPNCEVDVAIHCGDLTETCYMDQFRRSITALKRVKAELSLVIPGNHDWAFEPDVHKNNTHSKGYFRRAHFSSKTQGSLDMKESECMERREALSYLEKEGIHFLEEGRHVFHLTNGARLCVFASPWTPKDSKGSAPGFRYAKGGKDL